MPYQFDMFAPSNKPSSIPLRELLARGFRAILAPASGGCSRYIFSAEVELQLDGAGILSIKAPERSTSQLAILQVTTQSLHIPLEMDEDGITRTYLVLTGRLQPPAGTDPSEWQPFTVISAHISDISGTVQSVNLPALGLASTTR